MTTLPLPDVYRIRVILDFFFLFCAVYHLHLRSVFTKSSIYNDQKRQASIT